MCIADRVRKEAADSQDQVPVHEAISHIYKEHKRTNMYATLFNLSWAHYESLPSMPTIKRNKLVWFGHVMWQQPLQYHPARHNWRQMYVLWGQQRKSWFDNIIEWTEWWPIATTPSSWLGFANEDLRALTTSGAGSLVADEADSWQAHSATAAAGEWRFRG